MSHSTGPIIELPSTIPTEAVEDFLIVRQDDPTRPATYVSGDLYTQLATTRETDFNFNVFDFFMPVGGGAPAHVHSFDDEIWYVADGDVQYNLGNSGTDSLVVPEGGIVFGPIDKTHGFLNLNSTTSISGVTPGARAISMTTPGLLDLFFLAGGTQVEAGDRDEPVPDPDDSTDQGFIDIAATIKFGVRTDSLISFIGPGLEEYQPPADALDYVIVLPEDAKGKVVKEALDLTKLDGFSIWTTGDHARLPQRPTFTGKFGIEYTSLVNREESGNKFRYNEFSLAPQPPENFDTFIQANSTGSQVVKPTNSQAKGTATLKLNSKGEIDYSLTVTGLDFGELAYGGTLQTPNDGDDVTGIHIHAGERGINGPHTFSLLDPHHQDENDLSIKLNQDGSSTLSGTWNQDENEIPASLENFFNDGVPGEESDFYFQVHTKENPSGEIRGQIASTTTANNFPDSVKAYNHKFFYVNEGHLSVKIGEEVRVVREDTFAYIAPGNEYSIANFGDETVESLAVTVFDREPPFPAANQLFPSPLNPQTGRVPSEVIFLGDGADFFDNSSDQGHWGPYRVYGGGANDELFATRADRLFGEKGNDLLDASLGRGGNRLYGGKGSDEILVNFEDRAFGGKGADLLDASFGNSHNLLKGDDGGDILLAGSQDQLVGGKGDDSLYIREGGSNLLYGGSGADQFKIANGSLPDTVGVEYPEEITSSLPAGIVLPDLVDTRNTIMDFKLGVDKIHILGLEDIASSFGDLELLPAFGDLGSTSIIADFKENGIEKEISLANVSNVIFTELSANDFVFA